MALSLQQRGPRFTAYEAVTVATTSIGFTAATYGDRTHALVTVETAAIRFRLDGTAPTATEGHIAEPGDIIELSERHEIVNFRGIRRDGTSATIRASFGS